MFWGDFNQDLLSRRLSTDARDLKKLFSSFQFTQDPTRITATSQTLIDHIYTSDTDKIIASGVSQCSISDHSFIFLTRRSKKIRSPAKVIYYRNFKSYSMENVQVDLQAASWDLVDTSPNVDEAWNAFIITLENVIDRHVPLCTKRMRAPTLPWLTSDTTGCPKKTKTIEITYC